jgi:hypothetical protein
MRALALALSIVLLTLPTMHIGQRASANPIEELFGLYYAAASDAKSDVITLVISPDGKPIPLKANDPGAPTQPGLDIGEQHYPFASSRFSSKGFSFRTASTSGVVFSFNGRFGREQVESIGGVPYLAGTLTEIRNGRPVEKKTVHFGHAVIL